jgi:poly(A) polymerase
MDPQVSEAWTAVLKSAAEGAVPRFPLKGRDAVKLGVPPGPAVGRLMAKLEDWWIAGDFQADREACMAMLKELSATATSPPAAGS